MKLHPLVWPEQPASVPLYSDYISAGFPSPAADYIDSGIDLVSILIAHPSSTYALRVRGDSMKDAGIMDGSVVLVDFSLRAQHDDIVVANLGGEFTVKRLITYPIAQLRPENPAYQPIPIYNAEDLEIVGVVTSVISLLKHNVRVS